MTIEAEDICKSYGKKTVLEDFSLSISSDSSYVLTGESGAGKTTFLRILLGLEKTGQGKDKTSGRL